MLDTINRLWKSKTFWLALAAIVTAIGGYVSGELSLEGLIVAIFGALGGVTIRDGVAKSEVAANVSTEMKLVAAPDIWASWAGRQLIALVKAKVAPALISKAMTAVLSLAREYGGQNVSDELRAQLQRRALLILRENKLIRVYTTSSKTLVMMLFMMFVLAGCSVFNYDQNGFALRWNQGGLDLTVGEPVTDVLVTIAGDSITYSPEDNCQIFYDPSVQLLQVQCEQETLEAAWFIELACINCSATATMYRASNNELIYLEGQ